MYTFTMYIIMYCFTSYAGGWYEGTGWYGGTDSCWCGGTGWYAGGG